MSKKLGNILDASETTVYDSCFNKVSDIADIDKSLPTLIIGMDLAKKHIQNFSMFERIDTRTGFLWTFTKKERRKEYLHDLMAFKRHCIMRKIEEIKYLYIDFPCYPLEKVKNFIKYINGSDRKMCFLTKDSNFIFIYSQKFKTVFGLSLTLCDYCGIDRGKVIDRIKANKNNRFVNGFSHLDSETRAIIGDNIHYILPLYGYFGNS